jgi:UDP-3-O-acyl-N-acetylglucosamine deacetylase
MQQAAQLRQRRIGVALHQLPQALLILPAQRRGRTTSARFCGDRAFDATLAEKLVHEPAAHAKTISHLLTSLQSLVTHSANALAKIQGVGLHATPPADLTLSPERVCSNVQPALAARGAGPAMR